MPRRDVPYPGMICSLKERIAEIADALKTKLHSINGVEGDADGDVLLVSDHPAVIITEDQNQHEIKIGLDNSELPAAYVTSVNGQTGTVNLIGADIRTGVYSSGNSATQDISTARASISGVNQNVATEATNRLNADNALQANINAVSATASNKVDKLVTAGPHVYTHYGSTQGELKYSTAIDYNSVAVRDNAGRFKVEDPVSGDTSKNVVTANWVSQTGNSSPNNLIHKTGIETFRSDKNFGDASAPDASSIILWSSGAYRRLRMRSSVDEYNVTPSSLISYGLINYSDKNDQTVANIIVEHKTTGGYRVNLILRKSDGTNQLFTLGETQ